MMPPSFPIRIDPNSYGQNKQKTDSNNKMIAAHNNLVFVGTKFSKVALQHQNRLGKQRKIGERKPSNDLSGGMIENQLSIRAKSARGVGTFGRQRKSEGLLSIGENGHVQ